MNFTVFTESQIKFAETKKEQTILVDEVTDPILDEEQISVKTSN